MPRKGRDLEKLVSLIERSLHGTDGVTISSPAFLPDADTGAMREFDVLIEFAHEHLTLRVAIECKDGKAKVGSPVIEGFGAKCQTAGVNQGVVVSSSGFTAIGLKKAERRGIRCLSLSDAEGFDWCACTGFWFQHPEILEGALECIAAEPIAEPYKVYSAEGNEFTSQHAGQAAMKELRKIVPAGAGGGPFKHLIQYGPQLGYVIGADGKRQDIAGMNLWLIYKVNLSFLPFSFRRYQDAMSGSEISSTAMAEFEVGDVSAKLMLVKQPDGSIAVSVAHAPRGKTTKTGD